jgi:hypothetical protein
VKLPALKGGASRKGKYLFQIASLKEKAGLAGKRTGQSKFWRYLIKGGLNG